MLSGVCGRKGGGGGESTSNCGGPTVAPWVPGWQASLQRLNGMEPKVSNFLPKKSVIVDLRLDIAAFCLLRENSLQITVITFVNNIDSRESCGLSLCPTSKLPQSCFQMFHPTLLLACQIFSVTSQKWKPWREFVPLSESAVFAHDPRLASAAAQHAHQRGADHEKHEVFWRRLFNC